ncbi:LacI family DNA-binding transcriptional regulator [Roseiarcus fermentans]|nr:LacI family DNA-binding transcriptional regulator [Roseiarcus fermentans]
MEDFSAASGISRPTLSRYFNDPQSVRQASRVKIEDAMERFGYRPNLFALNFNRRNPKTLGIVVPSLTDPFYASLVQRIERQALSAGYWTIVQNSQGDPDLEAVSVATLMSLKLAGVIAIPLGHSSRESLYRQMVGDMPVVFLDARSDAEGTFVGTDNRQSIGLMVDYLLRSGPPPSYFDMPDVNQNARERREAYEAAMLERGAEPKIISVPTHDWDFERIAFDEAHRLFETGEPIGETILCANDRIAFGVMAAACQAGVRLGRAAGLRVAGHDDHPLSQYACPSLTTVAQDVERLATISLESLMQGVADGANLSSTRLIEARLIMRASA